MSKPHKLVNSKTTKLAAFNSLVIVGALCFLSPAAYASAVRPADATPVRPVVQPATPANSTQSMLDLLAKTKTAHALPVARDGFVPQALPKISRDAFSATSQATLDHRAAVAKKKAEAAKKRAAAKKRHEKLLKAKKRAEALLATPATEIQAYALQQVSAHGWSDANFTCLVSLWNKESGWNPSASNGSSGAYGIPQALPGSKMATVGSDWKTNYKTQVKWGLGYIASSYGTPCAAWAHSQSTNWY